VVVTVRLRCRLVSVHRDVHRDALPGRCAQAPADAPPHGDGLPTEPHLVARRNRWCTANLVSTV